MALARFHRPLNRSLAVYTLVVDTKNNDARVLYERYGFVRFPDSPSHLFIPIETLRRATEQLE